MPDRFAELLLEAYADRARCRLTDSRAAIRARQTLARAMVKATAAQARDKSREYSLFFV